VNLILNMSCEFHYVTSFINIKYGDVAEVIPWRYSFCGQKDSPHPPYSPDVAPSDYCLFGRMEKILGGHKFTSDTEVQSVVRWWLGQQPASFFASGIQKLVDRWEQMFEWENPKKFTSDTEMQSVVCQWLG